MTESTEIQKKSAFSFLKGRVVRGAVFFAVIAGIAFMGGISVGAAGGSKNIFDLSNLGVQLDATPDATVNLADFWRAYNILNTKFVETHASSSIPTTNEKVLGAIAGLAASYGDPYTTFFKPDDAKIFKEDILGNFSGVGMEIGIRNKILTVIAPLKNSPSEKAGVRAGDMILSIDDKTTDGMSTDEAVKIIRGPKGSTVKLGLFREGKPLSISIVRDTIAVPTIDESFDKEKNVYTISLYSFTAQADGLFTQALAHFRASGAPRLLIDLRGDPGGYLDAAVGIASHFLPEGDIIVTEDYGGKQANLVHKSTGSGGVPKGTRVAILMDQGSASASEILSGALHDHNVATLIGDRSFGKGSVQELVNIAGGSLKVTVARWLTPSGKSISDGGLTPDIKVERTAEDATTGKDPQKDRAMQFLTTGK